MQDPGRAPRGDKWVGGVLGIAGGRLRAPRMRCLRARRAGAVPSWGFYCGGKGALVMPAAGAWLKCKAASCVTATRVTRNVRKRNDSNTMPATMALHCANMDPHRAC